MRILLLRAAKAPLWMDACLDSPACSFLRAPRGLFESHRAHWRIFETLALIRILWNPQARRAVLRIATMAVRGCARQYVRML